jgi:hypothetical protein
MLAHRPGAPLAQPIVQALVVRVVESLLQERPLQAPVDFGEKHEVGMFLPDRIDRAGPERLDTNAPGDR